MKTSIIAIVLIILFINSNLYAQESKREAMYSVSTGYVSFNKGHQKGMYFSNCYIRNTNSLFTYGAKLFIAHGEGDVAGLKSQHDIHISTTAFDFNGYINPFKSNKHLLLIGTGLSIDYTRISYLSNTDFITSDNKIYTLADTDGTITLLIPSFNVHYYYSINKNLLVGLSINLRDINFYQSLVGISGGVSF